MNLPRQEYSVRLIAIVAYSPAIRSPLVMSSKFAALTAMAGIALGEPSNLNTTTRSVDLKPA